MRIEFACETNADMPFVNTAVFRTTHGDVVIDRSSTYYTFEPDDKRLEMEWVGCYVWDGQKEDADLANQISDDIVSLVSLELEDDADDILSEEYNCDEPYYCCPIACFVDGRAVPVLLMEAL